MPFEKFGSNLRSIVCSVFHLLLQIVMQTDESVHGSCSCAALLHELLLLAHFLHTCLTRPAIKSSYSACTTFAISASIKSFVACDNIPSMTLPQRFSDALFERCQDNLRRCAPQIVHSTHRITHALTFHHDMHFSHVRAQCIHFTRQQHGDPAHAAHSRQAAAAAVFCQCSAVPHPAPLPPHFSLTKFITGYRYSK
jgi:hypothetical protein